MCGRPTEHGPLIQLAKKEPEMRSILLWLIGVPIPIIILIALLFR